MKLSPHTAQASDNVPARYDPTRLRRPTTPLTGRGRPIRLGDYLSVTAAVPATEMICGGGGRTGYGHCDRANVSASPPEVGWLTVHARRHHGEVCPLSGGVMSQPLSGPLQTGLRFLPDPLPAAPSAHLTTRLP